MTQNVHFPSPQCKVVGDVDLPPSVSSGQILIELVVYEERSREAFYELDSEPTEAPRLLTRVNSAERRPLVRCRRVCLVLH